MEVEYALAVTVADNRREEVAEETLLVVRMGASWAEKWKGSQLGDQSEVSGLFLKPWWLSGSGEARRRRRGRKRYW